MLNHDKICSCHIKRTVSIKESKCHQKSTAKVVHDYHFYYGHNYYWYFYYYYHYKNYYYNCFCDCDYYCCCYCYYIVIAVTFYSPNCLCEETAKGPFGVRVKLLPAHLSTTHGGRWRLHTVPLIAER